MDQGDKGINIGIQKPITWKRQRRWKSGIDRCVGWLEVIRTGGVEIARNQNSVVTTQVDTTQLDVYTPLCLGLCKSIDS